MAETQAATATPPAAPAIDLQALAGAIGAAVKNAVTEANKELHDVLGRLGGTVSKDAAQVKDDVKLTAADVKKLIGDGLAEFHKTTSTAAARDVFIQQKMADLPAVYRTQMPQTADPAELAKAEQAIRTQYQADFKAAGGTAPNVTGAAPGSATPAAAAVDVSKLSPDAKIAMGLQQEGLINRVGTMPNAAAQGAVNQAAAQAAGTSPGN